MIHFYKYFGLCKWQRNQLFRLLDRNYTSTTNLENNMIRPIGQINGNPMYAEIYKFNTTLTSFISELSSSKIFEEIRSVAEPYKEILEYNLSRGRRLRAMMLIHTYRELTSNYSELEDNDDIKKIYALAWSVEIANSWAIMYDDVIDDSEFRRGALSWYYKKNKNISIIFDAEFLRESINILLDQYFSEDENYLACSRLLRETIVRMEMGLTEETKYENVRANDSSSGVAKIDPTKYTYDVYHKIVFNKTGNITYYLPLSLALLMAGKFNANNRKLVTDLAVLLGNLWQAQNDYLDVYGDPKHTGKFGTDIQCGACTWCILKALEVCSPEQKEVLKMNYGQPDPGSVQRVKKLFAQIEMKEHYRKYIEESRQNIVHQIEQFPDENLQIVLKRILEATFRDEE